MSLVKEILAIGASYKTFFKDDKTIEITYRKLVKQIHPDVCDDPSAEEAFKRLTKMRDEALSAGSPAYTFALINGKNLTIASPLYVEKTELGTSIYLNNHILYDFNSGTKKFSDNFLTSVNKLTYGSTKIDKYFKDNDIFPQAGSELKVWQKADNGILIAVPKVINAFPLQLVVKNLFNNKIPAHHMAWMITRLLNICCFLNKNKMALNGLSLNNLCVNLDSHIIYVTGGMWYAAEQERPMIGTNKEVLALMPPKVKSTKLSNIITDIECVKAFGRKYLATDAPQAMKDYLFEGSLEDPIEELRKWDTTLDRSFGRRNFVKVNYNKNDIYKN